jgi:thymidylate synthase ThyX
MVKFSNYEKQVLDHFFTSSNEEDTVYAAKQTLPQEIIGYIIGRASRAKETFREMFLNIWKDEWKNEFNAEFDHKLKPCAICDSEDSIFNLMLNRISDRSFKFLNEFKLHNSLRDVPHVAVFCDELSILQTKVWEHEVVAEYQEKSTRYRPFVASNVFMPNGISGGLKNKIEIGHGMLIEVYNEIFEKTNKRDLARYLLPVASKTAMACMANIRAWERIVGRMMAYPTVESKTLANAISNSIRGAFGGKEESFNYNEDFVKNCRENFKFINRLETVRFMTEGKTWGKEQEACVQEIGGEDVFKIDGLIDIGAHRDLQRHRSIIQNFPDYRPIYGFDKLVEQYIGEELSIKYEYCMEYFNKLFWEAYEELKGSDNIGEIQYIAVLGHMTRFWYVTDWERWNYVFNLRTGDLSQKSTNPKTVHFSYSAWCKEADNLVNKYRS